MSFFTASQMESRLREARQLGMKFPWGSENLPLSQWQAVANGIGPGAWSRRARKVSTMLQPYAEIASILHDMGYCCPVKDREHFNRYNRDFHYNICAYVRAHTWKVSLVRGAALAAAWIEYLAVQLWGWEAFISGITIPELDDSLPEGPEGT